MGRAGTHAEKDSMVNTASTLSPNAAVHALSRQKHTAGSIPVGVPYFGKPMPDNTLMGKEERTIAQRLIEGPAHIDVIARDCGISAQLAGSVLMMLELSGFVEQLPGKYYKMAE